VKVHHFGGMLAPPSAVWLHQSSGILTFHYFIGNHQPESIERTQLPVLVISNTANEKSG